MDIIPEMTWVLSVGIIAIALVLIAFVVLVTGRK